jgi:hypothetical protein
MGEIWERNGRDEKNLSRVETPLYKGIPSDYGRDERIFELRVKFK